MPSTDSAPTDAPAGPAMDTIVALSKRRGLVFPNSEIYGGLRSSWDYGPIGVHLKRNVKDAWFRSMVQERGDIIGLDSAIIMSPKVWEASGHVATFTDPLVECTACNHRFRVDKLEDPETCPNCGARRSFTEPRAFNLMFKTFLGPVPSEENVAYLRPETAQGIFVDYELARAAARRKLPFGIAQVGKSFRNEITPGNFIFRTREFEQMEMEFFCAPEEAQRWFDYWLEVRKQWYLDLGMRPENVRLRPHSEDELAHYAVCCSDVEYRFPWGWDEMEGVAHRGDYDLRAHSERSGVDLSYFDQEANRRFLPHVVEPAAGADRATLAFLLDAYEEEEVGPGDTRVVLRLHPRLAPIKVAVLPLSKNERLVPLASEVAKMVRPAYMSEFDVTGSIGKRYRRQDEIGTPLCVTVDFDSLDDNAVTIRERDGMTQKRVPIPELLPALRDALAF